MEARTKANWQQLKGKENTTVIAKLCRTTDMINVFHADAVLENEIMIFKKNNVKIDLSTFKKEDSQYFKDLLHYLNSKPGECYTDDELDKITDYIANSRDLKYKYIHKFNPNDGFNLIQISDIIPYRSEQSKHLWNNLQDQKYLESILNQLSINPNEESIKRLKSDLEHIIKRGYFKFYNFNFLYGNTVPLMSRLVATDLITDFWEQLPFSPSISTELEPTTISFGGYRLNNTQKTYGYYEPKTNVINWKIIDGFKSFFHEYSHFLDYRLGMYIEPHKTFIFLTDGDRGELSECAIKIIKNYQNSNSADNLAKNLSKKSSQKEINEYWFSNKEIFARCMDSYFQNSQYIDFEFINKNKSVENPHTATDINKNKILCQRFINLLIKKEKEE